MRYSPSSKIIVTTRLESMKLLLRNEVFRETYPQEQSFLHCTNLHGKSKCISREWCGSSKHTEDSDTTARHKLTTVSGYSFCE